MFLRNHSTTNVLLFFPMHVQHKTLSPHSTQSFITWSRTTEPPAQRGLFCWRMVLSIPHWLEHVTPALPLWPKLERNTSPILSILILLGNCLGIFELMHKVTEHLSYRAAMRTTKDVNLCTVPHMLSMWLKPRIKSCLSFFKKKSYFSNPPPVKSKQTNVKILWPQTQISARTNALLCSALPNTKVSTVKPLMVSILQSKNSVQSKTRQWRHEGTICGTVALQTLSLDDIALWGHSFCCWVWGDPSAFG